jgi:hypothetical protein
MRFEKLEANASKGRKDINSRERSGKSSAKILVPAWPRERVIREAVNNWNVRHSPNKLHPETSPWPRLCAAVLTFVRHDLTDYDQRLSELESQISVPANQTWLSGT